MLKKTYKMEYTCRNCGTTHQAHVPMGMDAKYGHGRCPYCGKDSPYDFTHTKPSNSFS
jgi:DNA-directed RNA polymerase subunit RPC12/RpoP